MVVHTMEFQNDHFSFRAKRQFKKSVMQTIFSNRIKSAGLNKGDDGESTSEDKVAYARQVRTEGE